MSIRKGPSPFTKSQAGIQMKKDAASLKSFFGWIGGAGENRTPA